MFAVVATASSGLVATPSASAGESSAAKVEVIQQGSSCTEHGLVSGTVRATKKRVVGTFAISGAQPLEKYETVLEYASYFATADPKLGIVTSKGTASLLGELQLTDFHVKRGKKVVWTMRAQSVQTDNVCTMSGVVTRAKKKS